MYLKPNLAFPKSAPIYFRDLQRNFPIENGMTYITNMPIEY